MSLEKMKEMVNGDFGHDADYGDPQSVIWKQPVKRKWVVIIMKRPTAFHWMLLVKLLSLDVGGEIRILRHRRRDWLREALVELGYTNIKEFGGIINRLYEVE